MIDDVKYRVLKETIDKLKKGDPVEFEGTLEMMGNEFMVARMELRKITLIDEFVEVGVKMKLLEGVNELIGHLDESSLNN